MHDADLAPFWSDKAVAVTGATGFVGLHLALLLRRLGARVTALVRATSARERLAGVRCVVAPLDDAAALARACAGSEYLFHLAGAVDFDDDWRRFRLHNVEGTRNVLAAARAAGVRRLVHTSSIVAVGATRRPVVQDETAPWDLGRLRVPYLTTKREAEEVALAAGGPPEVVVVNPACVVGAGDFSGSEFGTLCRRFWKGRLPFHFGGGNNFVDVADVARGCLLAAARGRAGERYVLGGVNRTYASFFMELARVAPHPLPRLRLPASLAPLAAAFVGRRRKASSRPYLTAGQARILPLYFFFTSEKATRELGYRPRPFRATLADAYAFWMGAAA